MKIKNPFSGLSRSEWILWIISVTVVAASFMITPEYDIMTLSASLVGVTALIFVAKGYAAGQFLTLIFSVLYGIISFRQQYYGEMITYLFMTSPAAVIAIVTWLKNPFEGTAEVSVRRMTKKDVLIMSLLAVLVTTIFYFILKAMGNASLIPSTISVTTSFLAVYMSIIRSPYYAVGYAANDVVLIVLWVIASVKDISCLPMVMCFTMFLVNDVYGFLNWHKMQKRQEQERRNNLNDRMVLYDKN